MRRKRVWIGVLVLVLVAVLPLARRPARAMTYTVTNTNDSGPGSLRQAIIDANDSPGPDTIEFNIPDCGGVCTIQPQSELPPLSWFGGITIIDGYSASKATEATDETAAVLQIEIDGTHAGDGAHGLIIESPENVIKGLVINRFSGHGVYLSSGAISNTISGNYIGTDASGTVPLGNGKDGVYLDTGAQNNTVGGTTPGERNVISGNADDGVHINDSDGNIISGNYIGTDAGGTAILENRSDGVFIDGGAQNNTIGGNTAGERNAISGNADDGVHINDSDQNIVSGNHIGTDADGTADLGNGNDGVYLGTGAQNNTVGGNAAVERNVISGNTDDGVHIFDGDENTVSGNYIGTDVDGAAPLGNRRGVYLGTGAQNNTVGGDTAGEGNVISGNGKHGVQLYKNDGNIISGNYIGTDFRGTANLGNGRDGKFDGVFIGSETRNNTIGGSKAGERNVISGNSDDGVHIFNGDKNIVSGNYIGTDASGTADLRNRGEGVFISEGAQDNTIGPGNVIAYNVSDGVEVEGPDTISNTITRNSVFSNIDAGIDLTHGANRAIARPNVLTANLGSTYVIGTACAGCTVEVFGNEDCDGEGKTFLGETVATDSGVFTATVDPLTTPYVTATATDAVSDTSEFSVEICDLERVYLPRVVQGHCPDNYEPNDSCSQAHGPLTSGQTYQSWITVCDRATYRRSDYFYIDITTTDRINIDLTNISAGTDYDLYLYEKPDCVNYVDESAGTGSSERISYPDPTPGTYHIRVYGFSGFSPSSYSLRVTYD